VENSPLVWSVSVNGLLLLGFASNSCPFLKLVPLIQPQTDLPEADATSVKRRAIEHSHGVDAVGNLNGNDAPSTETAPRTPRIGRANAGRECVDYRTN
jgi:hypothetical protein